MLLAIDTSTSYASLALLEGFRLERCHAWLVGQRHSVEIFAEMDALLTNGHAHAPQPIQAVAVATGPGSFNGTRVAVTVAKTLAFVWQVPLIGVPTLHGIAQAYAASPDDGLALIERGVSIVALLEAGRDELYSCWYDLDVRSVPERASPVVFVRPRGTITLAKVDEIVASAPAGVIALAGEMSDAHRNALHAGFGAQLLASSTARVASDMRAEGIGLLAQARLLAGEKDDPLALEPTYVRRPNISTSTRHPVPGNG